MAHTTMASWTAGRPAVLTARWVLPVAAEPIEQGAVLVNEQGCIAAVGPAQRIVPADLPVYDLGEAVVLPGLVNVHAHPELTAFRGLLDDLPFHEWIPTLMRCKSEAELDDDDFAAAAHWACVEALRAGITTLAATETSGAAVAALQAAGMRGIVYLETFGPDLAQADTALAELRQRLSRLARLAGERVQLGVSPHAAYTVSDALYRACAQLARTEALPLATHAAEAQAEDELIRAGTGPFAERLRARGIETPARGTSAIELLERTGVLALRPLLIHGVRMSVTDLQRVADHGAALAHCPVANARLGHGTAPMVEALEAGIRVGLGTDSVASNNRLDLLEEARAAQLVQRARLQSSDALSGDQLLRLVTVDGARALGLDQRVGTIEPGKDADLCAIALNRPHTVPAGHVVNALFHAARGSDVIMTMVQGRVCFDGTKVTTLDEIEWSRLIQQSAARLRRVRDTA